MNAIAPLAEATRQETPADPSSRKRIRQLAASHAAAVGLIPPLTPEELDRHTTELLERWSLPRTWRVFTSVVLGGVVWADELAAVPFERRLLLLPQCLRPRNRCPASFDDVGLLCEHCGGCVTAELEQAAENLGYAVVIAEGTTIATRMLATGQLDAIVGVGCLDSLERSFPHTLAAGVPSVAIPLLNDGCSETRVERAWFDEVLLSHHESSGSATGLERSRQQVSLWFEQERLAELIAPEATETEQIACRWLAAGGKRWRPLLTTAIVDALGPSQPLSAEVIERAAVAVECFHKASLAHDDIEDGDTQRYGEPTLHEAEGLALALNTGDLLIGEGYRLLAELDLPAQQRADLLTLAARRHRELCLGQGLELEWCRQPGALSVQRVLDIFRLKTAPAFDVALSVGAILGGANEPLRRSISRFAGSLGIAYQIADDLDDVVSGEDTSSVRLSLLLALGLELSATDVGARVLDSLSNADGAGAWRLLADSGALDLAREHAVMLRSDHAAEARRAVEVVRNWRVKALLLQVLQRALRTRGGA